MTHLKLSLEKAQTTYKNGDAETKKLLIDLYGEEHFKIDVVDRLKDYESACKVLNRQPLSINDFSFLGKEQARRQFARHKIVTGIEAINDGWIADFENEYQYKYYNWLYNRKNGFSFDCGSSFDFCSAGSDLYIESREKAEFIQKIFKDDYIVFMFGY